MFATMNGNTVIIPFPTMAALTEFVHLSGITQFAVNGLDLSTPVTDNLEEKIPGILHGARCRAKEAEEKPKPPSGPGGNPDGTPPGGGTPGTPVLDRYTYTEARAA